MACGLHASPHELTTWGRKSDRLHLLHGLEAILLDIDKAIAIIRNTKLEAEVVPNLMKGFGIDEVQAEFVAELKLRNINEEYIAQPHEGHREAGRRHFRAEGGPGQRAEDQAGHQRRACRGE